MALLRPYFRPNQIISGQYATVGEFVTKTGEDYEGPYHILPTGQAFTEYTSRNTSQPLYYKRTTVNDSSKEYNALVNKSITVSQHTSPKYFTCVPTAQDYLDGFVTRYFCQRRNDPQTTIMEISYDDFTGANNTNSPGISLALYTTTSIVWYISKVNIQEAESLNMQVVQQAEKVFKGLSKYLTNYTEFYR